MNPEIDHVKNDRNVFRELNITTMRSNIFCNKTNGIMDNRYPEVTHNFMKISADISDEHVCQCASIMGEGLAKLKDNGKGKKKVKTNLLIIKHTNLVIRLIKASPYHCNLCARK